MDFRVLGPFEVHDDGTAIPIGAFRQRAVLALLTIYAGQTLSTDRIIDEIWSGSPPPSALKTLHAYVSRLRSVLHASGSLDRGAELLLSRSPGYVLVVDDTQIDAFRFERMVSEASEALSAGRADAAAQSLREAMSLWRGTALADFAYESFAANESQRLMERRTEALEMRIDADLALARHAAVVAELEGLVVEHPMREKLWVQLMTALYRCGRQADALAAYGRIRRSLIEELGIEPGPELRLLERQVLEQSAELAWQPVGRQWAGEVSISTTRHNGPGAVAGDVDSSEVRRQSGGIHLLPLVGREAHLDRLAELVRDAQAGEPPRLALVMGEAGCGKSRLLAEFGRMVADEGVLVATGSAERETSLPYGPFAEMVRSILDAAGATTLERVGHLRADLAWLVPELGPQPTTSGEDLGLARARLFEAVLQLFAKAGSGQPLLLVLDDAHRIGEGARSFLHALLDRRWVRPVVVVLAARTEPGDRRPRADGALIDLLRREGTVALEVGRLSTLELDALVTLLAGRETAVDHQELAARLSHQTAGIPLLVREVLAGGDPTELTTTVGAQHSSVSPLISSVIGHRLNEISADAQRLLEVASVIGMQFDVDVLSAVHESSPTVVLGLLEEALEAGVLVETQEFDRFAFDHGLIRDVAGASVSAGRQIRLHGRAAEVMAARGLSVDAAVHGLIGYAGITAEIATELALHGADAALSSLDFEVARTLCTDALAGPAGDLSPGVRADLLLSLGRAESLSGRPEAAEDAWRSAADLARSEGDNDRLAQIAIATDPLGRMIAGTSELRWELLSEVLERTGPDWTPVRLLVASQWLTEAVLPNRRAARAELVVEVVDAAISLRDPYALAAAYHARHVLSRSLQVPPRRQWSDDLVQVAEEIDSDEWLFKGYMARLIDTVVEADGKGMDLALDRLRQTCARYRSPRALWIFELARASCARLRGEFEIASEHADAAAKIGESNRITDASAAMGAIAFLDAYHLGGLSSLRTVLTAFAEMVPEVAAWTFGAGLAAAADGNTEAAVSALNLGMERLLDEPEEIWLASLCLAAELVGLVGADEPTITRLRRLLAPHSGQFTVVGALSSEFGPTDRGLGILSAAAGDLENAGEHFASAIGACELLRARPWELRTRADWLVVERSAGRAPRPWWGSLESELDVAGLGGALERLRGDFAGR
jgi:DNA-binding SARP family transcriptional activator/tetratricopeptide (TPR) repeat protein